MKIQGDIDSGIKGILRNLLESGKVEAVFAVGDSGDGKSYFLVTDPAKLDGIRPLLPFMPENAANLLSRLTSGDTISGKIAVVIKPCELRAFAELVKREQAERDNFIFISPVCGGALNFDIYNSGALENALPEYWKAFFAGENPADIRPTCAACEHFVPMNADITVFPDKDGCELFLNTDAAVELFKNKSSDMSEGEFDSNRIEKLKTARKAEREKLFDELKLEDMQIKGLIDVFGRCLGCHGCSSVCPICYCALCAFDTKENEFQPPVFENELSRRGAMRVPPNTVFFHLGRITHMSISCVGCGMCADVCPVDIPVASIFTRVGDAVQKVFDYIPGSDFEEPVPLSTFIEDELAEVEE